LNWILKWYESVWTSLIFLSAGTFVACQ